MHSAFLPRTARIEQGSNKKLAGPHQPNLHFALHGGESEDSSNSPCESAHLASLLGLFEALHQFR